MVKKQLYTWVGSKSIESYSVESCVFHRVLAYNGIDYESLPGTLSQNDSINDLYYTGFPFFVIGESRISNVYDLIRYSEENGIKKPRLWTSLNQTTSRVYLEWAKSISSTLHLHLRFVNPTNFNRLVESSKANESEEHIIERLHGLQVLMTESLKIMAPELGGVYVIREKVRNFALTLQELIKSQNFINGSYISLADLYLFSSVHMLLDPMFAEFYEFCDYFEPLKAWMSRVNDEANNKYTISPMNIHRKAS